MAFPEEATQHLCPRCLSALNTPRSLTPREKLKLDTIERASTPIFPGLTISEFIERHSQLIEGFGIRNDRTVLITAKDGKINRDVLGELALGLRPRQASWVVPSEKAMHYTLVLSW